MTYSPDWINIEKEGWLVKLGANVKTLTRTRGGTLRCVVRGLWSLEYYEDESLASRKGGQTVGNQSKVKMHGEDEQGFYFKLISSGQELHLTAPTHEVRLE